MKINSLSHINTQKSPTFSSTERTRYRNLSSNKAYTRQYYSIYEDHITYKQGINPTYSPIKIENSNYTTFFRDDIFDWKFFAKKLGEEFKFANKVNTYDFGCSDGSEAYTLAISLIEELGEDEAKKFFPIIASDNDKSIIKKAQSGKIFCTASDVKRINSATSNNFDKYFDIERKSANGSIIAIPKPILSSNVIFKQKDITKELDNVCPQNSLLLCRNFWRYLPENKLRETLIKLQKLEPSSLIVLGSFDLNCSDDSTPYFFSASGFLRKNRFCLRYMPSDYSWTQEQIKKIEHIGYSSD